MDFDREVERRPLALLRLEPEVTAHLLYQPLGYRQTQPRASVLAGAAAVCLLERHEEALAHLLPDAAPRVPHHEVEHPDLVPVLGVGHRAARLPGFPTQEVGQRVRVHAHSELHLALVGELHGVGEEVGDHLSDAHLVPVQVHGCELCHAVRHVEVLFPGLVGEHVHAHVDAAEEVERRVLEGHVVRLDLGKVQDVVDEVEELARAAVDDLREVHHLAAVAPLARTEAPLAALLQQEAGARHDRVHGRADLVAHVGQKALLRLRGRLRHVLQPHERAVGALEVAVSLEQLGDVGQGDSVQLVRIVLHKIRPGLAPELLPVPPPDLHLHLFVLPGTHGRAQAHDPRPRPLLVEEGVKALPHCEGARNPRQPLPPIIAEDDLAVGVDVHDHHPLLHLLHRREEQGIIALELVDLHPVLIFDRLALELVGAHLAHVRQDLELPLR
mmetsp:Transcript_41093/g.131448  ORF Transcript_41093/g.131448 Transcript_41093/m.131448 type:complete len:442 (+) Transcript_41093:932-2257(+)